MKPRTVPTSSTNNGDLRFLDSIKINELIWETFEKYNQFEEDVRTLGLPENYKVLPHMKTALSNAKIPVRRSYRRHKKRCVMRHWNRFSLQINMIWDSVQFNLKSVCKRRGAVVMTLPRVHLLRHLIIQMQTNLHPRKPKITLSKVK